MLKSVSFVKKCFFYFCFGFFFYFCHVIVWMTLCQTFLIHSIMFKINDLYRLAVIEELYDLKDSHENCFYCSQNLDSLSIKISTPSRNNLARFSVTALHASVVRYVFYGVLNVLTLHVEYKSVEIQRPFMETVLLSINNLKITRLWHLEEEGEGDAAAAVTGFPAAESECKDLCIL